MPPHTNDPAAPDRADVSPANWRQVGDVAQRIVGALVVIADVPMSAAVVTDLRDARFAADITCVHSFGPAFLGRLLSDWAAERVLRSELEALFHRAAQLDPAAVSTAGADRWSR